MEGLHYTKQAFLGQVLLLHLLLEATACPLEESESRSIICDKPHWVIGVPSFTLTAPGCSRRADFARQISNSYRLIAQNLTSHS